MKSLKKLFALLMALVLLCGFSACGKVEVQTPVEQIKETYQTIEQQADAILGQMTVQDKLRQVFIIRPEALSGAETGAADKLAEMASNYSVGGFLFLKANLPSDKAVLGDMLTAAQKTTYAPLLCIDQEGGLVDRLKVYDDTAKLDSMFTYKSEGAETAKKNAKYLASDCRFYGFNTDFAPVADTWSNTDNTVIGKRAYSNQFDEAATLVAAAVEGFRDQNMICCLKHFPGHGDTTTDSHFDAAVVSKTVEELRTQEFVPFRAGINAGADLVMIGHLTMASYENELATVSPLVMQTWLRQELGFDGVIVTDSLNMGAVNGISADELVVRAFLAGADLLLDPANFWTALKGMEDAYADGRITDERLNESVRRILVLKLNHGLL